MTALTPADRAELLRQLVEAGCVAAPDEARQLVAAAGGESERLRPLVRRRVGGEPLAWVTGGAVFCGLRIAVHPGVFVPRWHSEPLARRAARLLPHGGRALDIGTGCGAIACVLRHRRPGASVLASDCDPEAVRCARANGVEALEGDLFSPFPAHWRKTVDVLVGVLPCVPSGEIEFLARDAREWEPMSALDGGEDGLDLVRQLVAAAPGWLRPGGHLLVSLGGRQPERLRPDLRAAGLVRPRVVLDPDGDVRGIVADLASAARRTVVRA